MSERESVDKYVKMIETLWVDVEGPDGIKTAVIEIRAVGKAALRLLWALGVIAALCAAFISYLQYLHVKHEGALVSDVPAVYSQSSPIGGLK